MNEIKNEDYLEAKTRLTNVKADREELKLALERGDILSREEVNQAWADKVNIVKNKLLAIPNLAPQIKGLTSAGLIKNFLTIQIREILNELAEQDNGFNGDDESLESSS